MILSSARVGSPQRYWPLGAGISSGGVILHVQQLPV